MQDTLVLLVILIVVLVIGYLQFKTNFYWKWVGICKWNKLQPDLKNIREINDRINGEGKKINWIQKNIKII